MSQCIVCKHEIEPTPDDCCPRCGAWQAIEVWPPRWTKVFCPKCQAYRDTMLEPQPRTCRVCGTALVPKEPDPQTTTVREQRLHEAAAVIHYQERHK